MNEHLLMEYIYGDSNGDISEEAKEACMDLVARAWMESPFNSTEFLEEPELDIETVHNNSLATDFLVQASDEEKDVIFGIAKKLLESDM